MRLDSPRADEFPFIFDSWARSWQKSKWAGCVPNNLADSTSRACSSEIIDRGARVTVAVEEFEGTRRIVGYSVSEPGRKVLHWIYVKRDLRGLGVGRQLLRDILGDTAVDQWVYTHKTGSCDRFLRGMQWDPKYARIKG